MSNSVGSVEDAVRALDDISAIRKFFTKEYTEKTREPSCDKYNRGFNKDSRFTGTGKHEISFDSWYGYYGRSSCSTFLCMANRQYFWKCFDKWLNDNMESIMTGVAAEMEAGLSDFIKTVENERVRLDGILIRLKGGAK